MSGFLQSLARSPVAKPILPGFPDGARLIAQGPTLRKLSARARFAGRCLNAGSGEGLCCPFLESFAGITQIMNVDLKRPEKITQTRPDPRHATEAGSLTALPFPDGGFDGALCTEVIEHIPDHERAVAELARVLKPGAPLLLSVPQTPAPFDPNHARQGYTAEEMSGLLRRNGFEVVAHADCLFGLTRGVMHYWRKPWVRLRNGCPCIPRALLNLIAWFDPRVRIGKPWDLVVLARRAR